MSAYSLTTWTRDFPTFRWNISANTKNFSKPFSPVRMGPRSNLLGNKMVENLVTLYLKPLLDRPFTWTANSRHHIFKKAPLISTCWPPPPPRLRKPVVFKSYLGEMTWKERGQTVLNFVVSISWGHNTTLVVIFPTWRDLQQHRINKKMICTKSHQQKNGHQLKY